MPTKLYVFNGSPPGRTALITANAVGIPFDVVVFKTHDELHTPEMLQINPQHTLPFINDNGNIISESHAISAYFIGKYGKDDSLYPKNLNERAIVDQRMYYDASVMFPNFKTIIRGIVSKEYKEIPKEKIELIQDFYRTLEKYLDESMWIAGNSVTIADFSCGTTISSFDYVYPIDKKIYPKVNDWLNRVTNLTYFEKDKEHFEHYKKFIDRICNCD